MQVTQGGRPVSPERIDLSEICEVVEQAGYWRKANAIHAWFVENVQDGNDDQREYYVERGKLEELLEIVKQVLTASKLVSGKIKNGERLEGGKWVPIMEDGKYIEDASVAAELLPTQSGFFFGLDGLRSVLPV